jgi:hypothetical protein
MIPASTLASIYFIGKTTGNEAAAKFVLGMLFNLPAWIVYAVAMFFVKALFSISGNFL